MGLSIRGGETEGKRSQIQALSPEEHQELLSLIETVEVATVERLEALVELSNWREVALEVVMEQLGLQPSAIYAEALNLPESKTTPPSLPLAKGKSCWPV